MADLPQNLSYSGSFDPMGKIKPFSNLTGALKKPTTPQVTTPTATQSAGMIGGESLMDLKAKANSPSLSFSYTPKKTTITEMLDSGVPHEWFGLAFRECAANDVRTWAYAKAILNRWIADGKIQTIQRR